MIKINLKIIFNFFVGIISLFLMMIACAFIDDHYNSISTCFIEQDGYTSGDQVFENIYNPQVKIISKKITMDIDDSFRSAMYTTELEVHVTKLVKKPVFYPMIIP